MGEKGRILVVEDDAEIAGQAERMLRAEGYEVLCSDDSASALELVRQHPPDLVICDVAMPGMDGYGVLRALQAEPGLARVPVAFLSGQRDFGERVRAFRVGVVDFLSKPLSEETLLRRVERILDKRSRRFAAVASEPAGQAYAFETAAADSREPAAEAPEPEEWPESPPPLREETQSLLDRDPPSLPGVQSRLPDFDELPELMRDVLVVEDNPVFRVFLRELLTSRGFRVHEACDGEEGLREALERRPWLIISDVRMPVADGLDLCRRVRSHSLIRQTPLLFLSGWDDYEQRYQALELGADDFLSKETSIRELLIRIQLLMRRYIELGGRARSGAAIEGQIQAIGAPAVLQVCHLSRLTGTLTAHQGDLRCSVRFRDGELVGAECGEETGEAAVLAFLAWETGRYVFAPGAPLEHDKLVDSFGALILEGCRRLDEARREDVAPG